VNKYKLYRLYNIALKEEDAVSILNIKMKDNSKFV
jgi:hypothetical protein